MAVKEKMTEEIISIIRFMQQIYLEDKAYELSVFAYFYKIGM